MGNLWKQTTKGLDKEQTFESPGTIGQVEVNVGYAYFKSGMSSATECFFPITDLDNPDPDLDEAKKAAKANKGSKPQRCLRVLMHKDSTFSTRTAERVEWKGDRGELYPLWTVQGEKWEDLTPSAAKLQMELLDAMGFTADDYGKTFWMRVERRPDPHFLALGKKTETFENDEGKTVETYKKVEFATERFADQAEAMARLAELADGDEVSLSPWTGWPGVFGPEAVEKAADEIKAVVSGEDELGYEGDWRTYVADLWEVAVDEAEVWMCRTLTHLGLELRDVIKATGISGADVRKAIATE